MKHIIGVHYWDKKVHLCWSEAESISTASFNLPADLRRDDILDQEFSLQGLYRGVKQYINEKLGLSEFALLVCIPDEYGLSDIHRVRTAGSEIGIDVAGTISETMAMSLAIYGEYEFDGRMLSVLVSENRLSMAEYDFSDKGVERLETYISGRWSGTSLRNAPFLQNFSEKSLIGTGAGIVFAAGGMNACMSFEQSLKAYINQTGIFAGGEVSLKILDSRYVIEGLGYMTGKLEGRPAFAGLGIQDGITPYEICMSINGEMYPLVANDATVGRPSGITVKRFPEADGDRDTILLYEKRLDRFECIGGMGIPTADMQDFYRKSLWIGLNTDIDRDINIIIQVMESDKYIELPMQYGYTLGGAGGDSEMDVPTFIERILPIIDNLEYASRFAKDESNPYTRGIIQSYTGAIEILQKNGVTIIAGEGEPFDYNLQNAVAHVTDVDLPDNTVKQVMQTGYMYNGRVIRTASVIVAN